MKRRTFDNIRTAVIIMSAIPIGILWAFLIHGIVVKSASFTTMETIAVLAGLFFDGFVIGASLSWLVEKLTDWLFKDFIEQ